MHEIHGHNHHMHKPNSGRASVKRTKDAQIEYLAEALDNPQANYLENNIVKFIHLLRHLDIRISAAEAMDAIRAVGLVNIMNPLEVKSALQSTLIKDSRAKKIFDKSFNVFFAPPEESEQRKKNIEEMKKNARQQMAEAEEELVYNWFELTPEGKSEGQDKLNLTEEEKKTYTKLPEEARQKLQELLKKPVQKNPINRPKDLVEMLVRSHLNYWKKYMLDQELANTPVDVQPTGNDEMDQMLMDIVEQITDDSEIMYEDMQKIPDKDIPRVKSLIWKLSRQLATRISRRYRYSKKNQKLDMRRTIRNNIKFGGSLYQLKHKVRRVEKPKVVLISDVSGSMARYCSFVLQFIYGLASVIEDIETFIFSEDFEQITCYFDRPCDFDETMADIINKSKEWGKGTDLGKALEGLLKSHRKLLTRDTFVIIVSDTKTLAPENAAHKLADLRRQVRDVVWLNTMPGKQWAASKTVAVFKRHCRMFECNTLAQLEKIMRTQLF